MKSILLRTLLCTVVTFVFLLPAPGAQAQTQLDCAGEDVLAIYFDNGDINSTVQMTTPFNIYYCILNPTELWIAGFEMSLTEPIQPYFLLSEIFPTQAINVGIKPDYVVGFSSPLPVNEPCVVVMQQTGMVLDNSPRQFYLAPTASPSIPGSLVYATWDGTNAYPLVPAYPISNDFALPVAQFNGPVLDYCEPVEPLDMVVNISFDNDNDNIAGTSLGATDGFDADFDLIDANNSLTFPHPEWNNTAGDNYRHDIKAAYDPTLEVKQWTFVATATATQSEGRTVSLSFQPNFLANPAMDFELYDRTTGQTHDLFAQNTFTFFVADNTNFTRTFDLFVGRSQTTDPSLWVDVTATTGGYSEATNRLSTTSLATDGYDAGLDIPEPVHPPANYVSSSFMHSDWPLGPRFRTDARSLFDPTAATKTWPLRVETDQSGLVILNFGASFLATDNIGLQLRDMQSGQSYNLFPQMNYTFQANGLSDYDFEIVLGLNAPPALDPTSRVLNPGWSLVGLPLMPAGATLGTVIMDQAPGFTFMFDYQPMQGYGLLEANTVANQDLGYWIGMDTGFDWTMSGDVNLNSVVIDLAQGWNLIGNPLWFPGPFEGMAIVRNGQTIPWETAVASGYVAAGVQSYDNNSGSYFDAVDLRPWEGYWIGAQEANLQLVFNWENFQVLPARFTVQKSGLPVDAMAWAMDLSLVDSDRKRTTVTLGINALATEGYDSSLDMPMPPAPPSGGPMLALARPEWNLATGAYFSRDVMPPTEGEMAWNAVVGLENPGTATLRWDSSNWPENADFQLYLPTENRVVVMSMRDQSYVDLDVGDEPLPIIIRTPNMVSGVEDVPGLAYRLGVYPNPFNPMTTVSFDMPKAGLVEIRLYNVRGQLINVLGNERFDGGSHELVWQGRDRTGRNVPSGSYFAKLFVDGRAQGSVTKMSLVR